MVNILFAMHKILPLLVLPLAVVIMLHAWVLDAMELWLNHAM
jgi:hypothetical protein